MKRLFTKAGLLIAVALLALTGCAAMPYRTTTNQYSMSNEGSLYNGYCWYNGCAPYIYGPAFGYGYGWFPDEDGGYDGFIGGVDGFDDDDGGPGR